MIYATHDIPAFVTQSGVTLDVHLVYKTYGALSAAKDNAILVLTSYAAQHDDAEALFAQSDALDLSRYFVVAVNMLGNGLSTSPSNAAAPHAHAAFPGITVHDNVRCQNELITHGLGIERLRLVLGYSMGALQTFEWGAQHSSMVDAILPICGAARVSPHNWLFLDGAKAALVADQNFRAGAYDAPPTTGLLAFGRVYAGWMFSQTFFRERTHAAMGLATIEDVVHFAQQYFMRRDANDLLAMLWTWQHANIADNERFFGDFDAALGSIGARAIVMPCATDLYFTVADSELEVSRMPNAALRVIPSLLGHAAGSGVDPVGKGMIDAAINDLLAAVRTPA